LQAQLYHHGLISADLVEIRYEMARGHTRRRPESSMFRTGAAMQPVWQRLDRLEMPMLLLYGKDDVGLVERRALLLQRRYPHLDVRILDHCKHLISLDAPERFVTAAGGFLAGDGEPTEGSPSDDRRTQNRRLAQDAGGSTGRTGATTGRCVDRHYAGEFTLDAHVEVCRHDWGESGYTAARPWNPHATRVSAGSSWKVGGTPVEIGARPGESFEGLLAASSKPSNGGASWATTSGTRPS
jgi:hypothetical protein